VSVDKILSTYRSVDVKRYFVSAEQSAPHG